MLSSSESEELSDLKCALLTSLKADEETLNQVKLWPVWKKYFAKKLDNLIGMKFIIARNIKKFITLALILYSKVKCN